MDFSINLTKRIRRRWLKDGRRVEQVRHVLNYRDPKTGARRQEFFEHQKAAQARKSELINKVVSGDYVHPKTVPTVGEAIDHWLTDRASNVKANTLKNHKAVVAHIRGPFLVADKLTRAEFTRTGQRPKGARFLPMLGKIKLDALTTAKIREWHREVAEHVGAYTANRAKSLLKSILALAEEDFSVRAPSMPVGLGRGRHKPKKAILAPSDIARIIEAARADRERGIYYAFPFLAGTRPSEQLGLLWDDVDFDANVIRIRRIQERDGSLTEMTKTEAGTRAVPMGRVLSEMLRQWFEICPRGQRSDQYRIFPGPGRRSAWPANRRRGGGSPLLYQNWRRRYWVPIFEKLGLPYVTPHSARHSFISTMQAQGIEVGLVAKLAGHANAMVTLAHYTQAVRGGEEAVAALESAFTIQPQEVGR